MKIREKYEEKTDEKIDSVMRMANGVIVILLALWTGDDRRLRWISVGH